MFPADLHSLLAHLWQSTLCVFVAWLLTLALKNNRASVRYWVWLAASVKFLVPFSLLVSAGSELVRGRFLQVSRPGFFLSWKKSAGPSYLPLQFRCLQRRCPRSVRFSLY